MNRHHQRALNNCFYYYRDCHFNQKQCPEGSGWAGTMSSGGKKQWAQSFTFWIREVKKSNAGSHAKWMAAAGRVDELSVNVKLLTLLRPQRIFHCTACSLFSWSKVKWRVFGLGRREDWQATGTFTADVFACKRASLNYKTHSFIHVLKSQCVYASECVCSSSAFCGTLVLAVWMMMRRIWNTFL